MSGAVSYQQLAMFMPAGELAKMKMGDTRKGETSKDVMARKLKESKVGAENEAWREPNEGEKTLHESIKQKGVQQPVTIVHGTRPKTGEAFSDLQEGHHRVASANAVNPKMLVPVEHKEPHETLDW